MSESEKMATALTDIFKEVEWKERAVVWKYQTVACGVSITSGLYHWFSRGARFYQLLDTLIPHAEYDVEIVVRKR